MSIASVVIAECSEKEIQHGAAPESTSIVWFLNTVAIQKEQEHYHLN